MIVSSSLPNCFVSLSTLQQHLEVSDGDKSPLARTPSAATGEDGRAEAWDPLPADQLSQGQTAELPLESGGDTGAVEFESGSEGAVENTREEEQVALQQPEIGPVLYW